MRKSAGTIPGDKTRQGPGPEFGRVALGSKVVYLRSDLLTHAPAVLESIEQIGASANSGLGNRQSGFRLSVEGAPELFARVSRRGGLVRFLIADLYFGRRPRPVQELTVTAAAFKRGIPVAKPAGAIVEWVWPGVYRGVFVSYAMAGMTLWEFLRTDDEPSVRQHVLGLARQAIDTMHERGLDHADLNLHNLFVVTAGEQFAVAILDLDKARMLNGPLSSSLRQRNFRRLLRSALKLDPKGRLLDTPSRELLTAS